MLDDPNITQDAPTTDSSPTQASDTPETAPEAQNAPTDGLTSESPNTPIDTGDAGISQPENEPKSPENQNSSSGETESEPASEPVQASEPSTAQIPVNEPLSTKPEPLQSAPVSTSQPQPVSAPVFVEPQQNKTSLARELLITARNAIQFRKRRKLDKVMSLFLQQSKITNDEVEKYLHVSDATATRYLSILEKENKIKQVGKTGHAVSYSRI